MTGFQASRDINGGMMIQWITLSEQDTLGFYVYRVEGMRSDMDVPNDARLVTAGLIASAGVSGVRYQLLDTTTRVGATYSYWLAEIGADGSRTVFGPVRARSAFSVVLPIIVAGN